MSVKADSQSTSKTTKISRTVATKKNPIGILLKALVSAWVSCSLCFAQDSAVGHAQYSPNEAGRAHRTSIHEGGDQDIVTVAPGWWQPQVTGSLRPETQVVTVTVEDVLVRALENSHQIRAFSDLPIIRETAIARAQSDFDWTKFVSSQWDDLSDPVGNTLIAGPGISRYRDHDLTFNAGMRKKTSSGGQVSMSQQIGMRNNNSQYFVPNHQGMSKLVLGFTQPLLRGRGKVYNTSLICLAQIDRQVAKSEFQRQLQEHLFGVVRAYWTLYLERGALVQRTKSFRRAKKISDMFEYRSQLDASPALTGSAQASLQSRAADLIRARTAVKNAEDRLRSLVNDASFGDARWVELVPSQTPIFNRFPIDFEVAMADAVQSRPEIAQALQSIEAAGVRCKMSKNELLPMLNLVTEAYTAGLDAKDDIAGAWENQFNQGEPGYSIGLQYEVPIGNRGARSRNTQRRLELRQLRNQYASTLENVRLDVNVAVREVDTSFSEMRAKEKAMAAQEMQVDALAQRFKRLSGDQDSTVVLLQNLLNAQDRLTQSEFEYLRSQVTHNLSLLNLKKSTGTLLVHESVSISRGCKCGLPTNFIDKTFDSKLEAPVEDAPPLAQEERVGY